MTLYRYFTISFLSAIFLLSAFFIPINAGAQEPVVEQPEISVRQQIFTVRPTLELESLDRYSSKGILSNGFARYGFPVLLFGGALIVAHFWIARKRRMKCSKKECRKTYLRVVGVGAINAMALFVIFQLIGGVLAPASLKNLAVYVDDQQRFSRGDRVRATFHVTNSGKEEAKNLTFRNSYSEELFPVKDSIMFSKDGELPEEYLPLITDSEVLIPIGILKPGQAAEISYDFVIMTEETTDLPNTGFVTGQNISTAYSNISVLRRGESAAASQYYFEPYTQISPVSGHDVFLVTSDAKLREMPNDSIHQSWFADELPVEISDVDISAGQITDPVLPRPGTWLVQFEGEESVYYIGFGSELRLISSENAERIFGPGWQTEVLRLARIDARSYTEGEEIGDFEYPDGLYLTDGESRCFIVNQICRPVTERGIAENYLSDRFLRVTDAETLFRFPSGELIDTKENQLLNLFLGE